MRETGANSNLSLSFDIMGLTVWVPVLSRFVLKNNQWDIWTVQKKKAFCRLKAFCAS